MVFIASIEEDMGRITCGNAILSGTMHCIDIKSGRKKRNKSQRLRSRSRRDMCST